MRRREVVEQSAAIAPAVGRVEEEGGVDTLAERDQVPAHESGRLASQRLGIDAGRTARPPRAPFGLDDLRLRRQIGPGHRNEGAHVGHHTAVLRSAGGEGVGMRQQAIKMLAEPFGEEPLEKLVALLEYAVIGAEQQSVGIVLPDRLPGDPVHLDEGLVGSAPVPVGFPMNLVVVPRLPGKQRGAAHGLLGDQLGDEGFVDAEVLGRVALPGLGNRVAALLRERSALGDVGQPGGDGVQIHEQAQPGLGLVVRRLPECLGIENRLVGVGGFSEDFPQPPVEVDPFRTEQRIDRIDKVTFANFTTGDEIRALRAET